MPPAEGNVSSTKGMREISPLMGDAESNLTLSRLYLGYDATGLESKRFHIKL